MLRARIRSRNHVGYAGEMRIALVVLLGVLCSVGFTSCHALYDCARDDDCKPGERCDVDTLTCQPTVPINNPSAGEGEGQACASDGGPCPSEGEGETACSDDSQCGRDSICLQGKCVSAGGGQ